MIENKNDIEEERDIKKEDYLNNSISSWEDLDLNPNILRGIYANGFEKPSPIQAKGISPMIQKKDIIAQESLVLISQLPFSILINDCICTTVSPWI